MHFSKAKKRGRPSLNHPLIDQGTLELQRKKQALINKKTDLAFAESLLGILYAHQLISLPLYEAGQILGELGWRYRPCLGHNPGLRSCSFSPKISKEKTTASSFLTEKQDILRTQAWGNALTFLRTTGLSSYQAVLRVVFYENDLYEPSFLKKIFREIKDVQKGLAALELYFKGELRGILSKRPYPAQSPEKATMPPPALKESPLAPPPEYCV